MDVTMLAVMGEMKVEIIHEFTGIGEYVAL